jgi:hypothetical protein
MSVQPKRNAGMLGAVAIVAFAFAGIGLALQFAAADGAAFWVGAEKGAALVIGASAGAFVIAVVRARNMLASKRESRGKGGRGAQPHA